MVDIGTNFYNITQHLRFCMFHLGNGAKGLSMKWRVVAFDCFTYFSRYVEVSSEKGVFDQTPVNNVMLGA